MLNWAARYYPIVRILKTHGLFDDASLLEIGSGPVGIGRYRKVPFVGCDLSFAFEPEWPMTPITASATNLPVKNNEFDVVLASDMLEHVPPAMRKTVIGECLRVARKLVIFGFPCGPLAWESDKALFNTYLEANLEPPEWLAEHMDAPFPDADVFQKVDGWDVHRVGNESISFHSWMMKREMTGRFGRASSIALRHVPSLVETLLRRADRPPYYRQIFVLSRHDQN
jgi:Methyltransferase domain